MGLFSKMAVVYAVATTQRALDAQIRLRATSTRVPSSISLMTARTQLKIMTAQGVALLQWIAAELAPEGECMTIAIRVAATIPLAVGALIPQLVIMTNTLFLRIRRLALIPLKEKLALANALRSEIVLGNAAESSKRTNVVFAMATGIGVTLVLGQNSC